MGIRRESDLSHTPPGDRIRTAVLLQALPLLLILVGAMAQGIVRLLLLGVPFSFGFGYVYLRRCRRYLLTLSIMLTLLVGLFALLILSGSRSANPGSGEGIAILGAILLSADAVDVVVADVVQLLDVWRLASQRGR